MCHVCILQYKNSSTIIPNQTCDFDLVNKNEIALTVFHPPITNSLFVLGVYP